MIFVTSKVGPVSTFNVEAILMSIPTYVPQRPKTYLCTCVFSEDSDQSAHSRRLIRIITERILDSQGCKISACGQGKICSDCADAQVDLSPCLAHMLKVRFLMFSRIICICREQKYRRGNQTTRL